MIYIIYSSQTTVLIAWTPSESHRAGNYSVRLKYGNADIQHADFDCLAFYSLFIYISDPFDISLVVSSSKNFHFKKITREISWSVLQ